MSQYSITLSDEWFGKDEWYYQRGLKNYLQQILPPSLNVSDVHTSNEYITTNIISIYIYKVAH